MSFNQTLLRFTRPLLSLPPIIIGGVVLAMVLANRNAPEKAEVAEVARPLVVITAPKTDVIPRVLGYGTARPGDIWAAVADVSGRVVETHPELKAGTIVRKDEVVVQIDPAQYELTLAQLKAEIAQVEAQQAELEAQKQNLGTSLVIEEDSLALAQRDQERMRGLRQRNAVSESEFDQSVREVLTQRQNVQSLKSSLNVLPAQQQALVASLQAKQASLGQAQLNLDHTIIRAPLDCRLSEVSLEVGQFVTAGQSLFNAYGADVTEVEAQAPIDRVRTLLNPEASPLPISLSERTTNMVRKVFDVEATVRMRTGDFEVEWDARFDRIREELDLQTRTLRIVVAVDKPYENVVPGKRPPLAPGMFCEVELRGKPRVSRVVVPRTSVRDGAVYLVNNDGRLERRPVAIEFSQGGFSVIGEGLEGGERIVVSDPTPAVEGMLIKPTTDQSVLDHLLAEATGESPVR